MMATSLEVKVFAKIMSNVYIPGVCLHINIANLRLHSSDSLANLNLQIPTLLFTAVFAPQSTKELQSAIDACVQQYPDCSEGPQGPISKWNVSKITSMARLFHWEYDFNGDISNWDISHVTDMNKMFYYAASFNTDISKWNTSLVTDMSALFGHTNLFDKDISGWDVSKVTDMSYLFHYAIAFNSDVSQWDVSRVDTMHSIFRDASSFHSDISEWDVYHVTDMSGMFNEATPFVADISKWDVSRVTDISYIFADATSFNADLSRWDVSRVTAMEYMFKAVTRFTGDVSEWDVSRVATMYYMFSVAVSFNTNISKWNVSRVSDMTGMFLGAESFTQVLCGAAWVKSTAIKGSMFNGSSGSISADCSIRASTTTITTTMPIVPNPSWLLPVISAVGGVLFLVVVILVIVIATMVVSKRSKSKGAEQPSLSDGLGDATMPLLCPSETHLLSDSSSKASTLAPDTVYSRRSFATSNYKRFYEGTKAPLFQHDLLHAVHNMLKLFAARINPTLDQTTVEDGVREFMEKIQGDAFKNNMALKSDVGAVSEYLWTSAKAHGVVNGMELCSVLNAVIRDDVAEEIKEAVTIFRSINSRRVHRMSVKRDTDDVMDHQSYPHGGETWRGGGFRQQYRAFFESMIGRKYRAPGFLATTIKRTIASSFAFKADKTHPCALWRIVFDPRGEHEYEYRVQHMTFVANTLIAGENEYLFAPYSVFELVSVKWSVKLGKPHEFVIQAAVNNKEEDENLPLTPWY